MRYENRRLPFHVLWLTQGGLLMQPCAHPVGAKDNYHLRECCTSYLYCDGSHVRVCV